VSDMRDHCNCGRPFTLREWVTLPTAYYQAYSDCDGTVVQQAVDCPRCRSTLIASEVELVRNIYGPDEFVAHVMDAEFENRGLRDRMRWHASAPLYRTVVT
jgi:hypothetical protein